MLSKWLRIYYCTVITATWLVDEIMICEAAMPGGLDDRLAWVLPGVLSWEMWLIPVEVWAKRSKQFFPLKSFQLCVKIWQTNRRLIFGLFWYALPSFHRIVYDFLIDNHSFLEHFSSVPILLHALFTSETNFSFFLAHARGKIWTIRYDVDDLTVYIINL